MPFNSDECYCVICDLYFSSQAQRMEHIQESPDHPGCDYCQRRFLNKNILRNHFVYSRHHHYCASCEIEFQTPSGLRYHIEHAPVHCDDSDSEEEEEDDGEEYSSIPEHEWEEEMGRLRYPDEQAPEEDDSDESWEDFDDYDYESAEELKVPQGAKDEDEDTDDEDDDDENVVPHFSCPMCEKNSESVTCAPCGHLFCSPCITNAIKQTSACPICAEPALVPQLRKIFLA